MGAVMRVENLACSHSANTGKIEEPVPIAQIPGPTAPETAISPIDSPETASKNEEPPTKRLTNVANGPSRGLLRKTRPKPRRSLLRGQRGPPRGQGLATKPWPSRGVS
jgi:hypothetical protein